jgi:hypothetical protein
MRSACPLCHGPCNNPASPAPSLPRHVLDARRSANNRATAPCLRSPLLPLPRRRCTTAQASETPARLLAACRRLPRHILHRARGCAPGFVAPAVAVPPVLTFARSGLSRVLSAACAISFAHGFVGYAGVPLAVLHFVARRRLPAVKRTAALAGRGRLQDQNRATCCIPHPFGGYAAQHLAAPRPHSCSIPQVAHPQGKPAARDCRSKAPSRSVRCAQVHTAGQG